MLHWDLSTGEAVFFMTDKPVQASIKLLWGLR